MITDMINLILIDTGYPRYIGRFHIKMQSPVTQEEIDRKADLSNTLRNVSDIMNTLQDVQTVSSKLKILKSLLSECLADQDITDILQKEIEKLEKEEKGEEEPKEENNDSGLEAADSFEDTGSYENSGGSNFDPLSREMEEPSEDNFEETSSETSEPSNEPVSEPYPSTEPQASEPTSTNEPAGGDDNLPSFADLGVDGTVNL